MTELFDHPTLTDGGRALLRRMREHPRAPKFTGATGSRLRADDLVEVTRRTAQVLGFTETRSDDPPWLGPFLRKTLTTVPHFRGYGLGSNVQLHDVPTTSRRDLSTDIARFVPDDVDTDRLITYVTSGTTGHPLQVPSHPRVAAEYLAYHRRALRRTGRDLHAGPGSVGVALIGHQERCFTYTSVVPTQNEAGLVKLNLHPGAWRSPSDRGPYLDALDPEIISGDPISFRELLDVAPACRPLALFSTSMTLLPGLRAELEATFGCPVLDFYSMNEAGPIAVYDRECGGHVLLQPELHVELLDRAGEPVPGGERGEITLTGGFNFCLPLLRYRTGDFASWVPPDPVGRQTPTDLGVLANLAGRDPVRFRTGSRSWINNVDVLHAFSPLSLSQFRVHQRADASVELAVQGSATDAVKAKALLGVLLDDRRVTLVPLRSDAEKVRQFTSEFPGGTM